MQHMMATEKVYYSHMYLKTLNTEISGLQSGKIILRSTIAYPEGGGQEPDHGKIITADGVSLRFIDVQKAPGTPLFLDDFPVISVDCNIEHTIHPDDIEKISNLKIGDPITMHIDLIRREKLSISHSVSHLIYVGVCKVREATIENTIGCHIKDDSARFDFAFNERISTEEMDEIIKQANVFIETPSPIILYAHPKHPEARFWKCKNEIIPCGGTHIQSTDQIQSMHIKRKNLGKGKERINIEFTAELKLDKYVTL